MSGTAEIVPDGGRCCSKPDKAQECRSRCEDVYEGREQPFPAELHRGERKLTFSWEEMRRITELHELRAGLPTFGKRL